MITLGVDTALGACSVALIEGEHVLARRWQAMPRGHAEALAPMVEEAMREAGMEFSAIGRLAVTTGPGTFTGQRVGLAFMRGLRMALNRPLIGVTTLEAMAAAASGETGIETAAVFHEAKRGEVYLALIRAGHPLIPDAVAASEEALQRVQACLEALGRPPVAVAGTATEAAASALGFGAVPTAVRQPDALWVARLAAERPVTAEAAKPLYLRAPDARLAAGAIRLRPAGTSDARLLAELNAACLERPWDPPFFAQILTESGGFGFLAEAHGTPLGFVLGRVAVDEAEVLAIGVLSEYRRSGVGRRLLDEAARQAAALGASRLFLEVAESNVAARTLYETHGFGTAGLRKDYYGTGKNALILRADLPVRVGK